MARDNEDLLITGGIVAGLWFGVVKPIMNTFGLSDQDQAVLNEAQNTSPANNPFSPVYQPYLDLMTDRYGGMTPAAYYANLKANYDMGNAGSAPVNLANPEYGLELEIAKAGELINNAWPHFSLHGDRVGVEQALASVTNKTDVAGISAYLYYNYEKDLYKTLKEGGFMYLYGLPGEDLAAIVTRINNLPE